jgi:P pilus assembly chaperone PapD
MEKMERLKHFQGNMIKSSSSLIIVGVIVALILSMLPVSVSADGNPSGLTVTNAAIVNVVSPGQVITQTMTVSVGDSDPAADLTVSVTGVAQNPSGGYILLDPDQDTNPDTARPFVTVDPTSFHLDPGQSQDITATVTVPQNVSEATYYAMIKIANPPSVTAGSQVAIQTSVSVPVYLTIKGANLTETGAITGITTGTITNGQPVDISTTFQNTGNTYFKIQGETTVYSPEDAILDAMPLPETSSSLIPGMSRDMEAVYNPSGSLSPGVYTVISQIMAADDPTTVLDQSKTTFTIKTAYVPPPALGNVSLLPSGASTLQNSDGSISIFFPVGAAAVPVNLALNNIAAAQVPVAPAGLTLTGNYFDVEGLTGLLAKNATVSVKYTASDLSKASGKANQLVLLRWDAGTNKWVILGTKVNTFLMTLSASSNQMGIWAVAVSTVKTSGINWTLIGIPIAVLIILAIVGILLITRSKRKGKPVKSK